MSEPSQRQIWTQKAQQGDALAMARLLAAHYPILRARADAQMGRELRAKLEPEDVLQEVYLDVFRQMHAFENRGMDSFVNWVLTILDRKLTDIRRAFHRQKRDIAREVRLPSTSGTESYGNLLDQVYADSGTPSQVIRRNEAIGALLACLSHIPEPQRRVIELRFLQGQSVTEVARRLDKSAASVVAMTRQALKTLRESMDRLGEFTRGA